MKPTLAILIFFLVSTGWLLAQSPETKYIRVVDTLTAQEKISRNTVILKSELDSMFKLYAKNQSPAEPVKQLSTSDTTEPDYWGWASVLGIAVIGLLIYLVIRNQKRSERRVHELSRMIRHELLNAMPGEGSKLKSKGMITEKKGQSLAVQLEAAQQQNAALKRTVDEFSKSKQDFEMIKQQMMEVYKIRNYPGFSKDKSETEIVRSLLDTERSVAFYAYDHFLKPMLALVDGNKNNPAKVNPEERERILELLISLGLFYSEYLYLRINDLAVGGKIVERIGDLRNGNSINPALLKQLNVEHGSRALVLRMILDKTPVQHLSYPVFDETNLNLS